MGLFNILLTTALALAPATASPLNKRTFMNTIQTDLLAANGYLNLGIYSITNGLPNKQCNLFNADVRREWGVLTNTEKQAFTNAILCMTKKPSKYTTAQVPGARSRYDDFVATHINQTLSIHSTGNFLAWHRYFIWSFEQALQNECGYQGNLPYWNWGKYADNPVQNPMFNGDAYSMSGDGAYFQHDPTTNAMPDMTVPTANGGGCVTAGPFKNWTVNLGPVVPTLYKNGSSYVEPNPRADGLGYNPRCLRRDINPYPAKWTTDQVTADLIKNNADPYWFITNMQGDFPNQYMGVHTGGHFTVGGDPGGDFFASPGEPVFWLHHGMIDRVWWIWQNQDLKNRQYSISGTITFANNPPSRNATLDDYIDLGPSGAPITIRSASSTMGGSFCYVYI